MQNIEHNTTQQVPADQSDFSSALPVVAGFLMYVVMVPIATLGVCVGVATFTSLPY